MEVEDGGDGERRDEALEAGVAEELQGELGLEGRAGGVEDGWDAGGDEVEEAEELLEEEEGGGGEAALGAGVEMEAAGGVDVDLVDFGVGEGLEDGGAEGAGELRSVKRRRED